MNTKNKIRAIAFLGMFIAVILAAAYYEAHKQIERVMNGLAYVTSKLTPPNAFELKCSEVRCDIYLSETICPQNNYAAITELYNSTPSNVDMYIHLAGNGGAIDTVYYLEALLEKKQHKTIMSVDGSSYSAHAYIAMLSEDIEIADNVLLMFHLPARADDNGDYLLMSEYCKTLTGNDRGLSNEEKCETETVYNMELFENYLTKYVVKYLTAEELTRLYAGEDIYLTGIEFKKRKAKN